MRKTMLRELLLLCWILISSASMGYAQPCVVLYGFHCSDYHSLLDVWCFDVACNDGQCPNGTVERDDVNPNSEFNAAYPAFLGEQGSTSYSQTPVVCAKARNCSGCLEFFGLGVCKQGSGDWYDHLLTKTCPHQGAPVGGRSALDKFSIVFGTFVCKS